MKKYLLFLTLAFGLNVTAFTQLADGSIAPDFTLTDRDGTEHNLYSYLAEGKVVFIKFFACHCPSCWSYHNTGKLESVYQTYGPSGTDQIMVIMLEHDQNNPDAFYGNGGYTQGDWITGNSIPMVDVEGDDRSVFTDYNLTYYPMVMKICSDKTTELMSTSYTVSELFDEADDCAGTLEIEDEAIKESVYLDHISKELKLIGFNGISRITIHNMAGQEAFSFSSDTNGGVDVSILTAGMFVLNIESESGVFSQKIVVQ